MPRQVRSSSGIRRANGEAVETGATDRQSSTGHEPIQPEDASRATAHEVELDRRALLSRSELSFSQASMPFSHQVDPLIPPSRFSLSAVAARPQKEGGWEKPEDLVKEAHRRNRGVIPARVPNSSRTRKEHAPEQRRLP